MTLIEVMIAAGILTLVLGALLGSQILATKNQRSTSHSIMLYALANSVCDQVCGLGYDEVLNSVRQGGTQVIAINDPASGRQLPLGLRFGVETELSASGAADLSLKTDYSSHDGRESGMDALFGDSVISGQSAAVGARYATVRDLRVQVTAVPVAGVSAYTVSTRVRYTNAFGRTSQVSVARLISNFSGYASAY